MEEKANKKIVLVVGATGQLGTAVVRKLVARGHQPRAFVRSSSNFTHLEIAGVELAFGDLRDRKSIYAACNGIDTVIATANAAVPREKTDTFIAVDDRGYADLIDACKIHGVRHFIYASVTSDPKFDRLPLPRQKRVTEARLRDSGLLYTIFRADAFMDVTFAMMGSDMPLRGSEAVTVARPFWFSSKFFGKIKDDVSKGSVGILGDGNTRRSYVCVDDVAEFLVAAIDNPHANNATFDIGGPEALSQKQVVTIFEKLLSKSLKVRHTPAVVFKLAAPMMRFFSPAAANLMGLNYCCATTDSVIDMRETAKVFGVTLTSAEEFLRKKNALAP
ncbi:MAG: SDR family oxidoreductase [Pyrinomonadaceae bacterium]